MSKRALIIGGTGQIGRAIAKKLVETGWAVTIATRTCTNRQDYDGSIRFLELDREENGALARVTKSGFDTIIDLIAYNETHADQLLSIENNVGSFLVISSASVYMDAEGKTLDEARENGFPDFGGPISESQDVVPAGSQTYSTQKVALERRLFERANRPVTILRPCAIHGPNSTHPREWWFVKRILDGRKIIPLAFAGQSRFHTTSVDNIAALVEIVLQNPATQALNVADAEAPSVLEIGRRIAECMNYRGEIVPVDTERQTPDGAVGWTPWSVPKPFTLDITKSREIGLEHPGHYADTVSATCDWLRAKSLLDWEKEFPILASYQFPLFNYELEDSLILR